MKWTWVKWWLFGMAVLSVCFIWFHTPGDHWSNTPNPQNQPEKPQQIRLHIGQFVNRVNRTRLPPYKPMELRSAGKYNTVNATLSCDSADAGGTLVSGNVYWTVFAGRRNRLALQEKFWVQLHGEGLITEVHLWDFTHRSKPAEGKLDQEWMKVKAEQHGFIGIFTPPVPKDPKHDNWTPYYEYYAKNTTNSDILLKIDDDIVFVNTSEFKCFVKFVDESVDALLVSANVVNNGVIAHFQQKLGCVPASEGNFEYPKHGAGGSLWESGRKALKLHQYFVSHKSQFYREEVIRFRERLSINFLGVSGRRTKQVLDLVRKKGEADDENALTMAANTEFKAVDVVYMRLVAAHVTFLKQIQNYPKVDENIIQLYS